MKHNLKVSFILTSVLLLVSISVWLYRECRRGYDRYYQHLVMGMW